MIPTSAGPCPRRREVRDTTPEHAPLLNATAPGSPRDAPAQLPRAHRWAPPAHPSSAAPERGPHEDPRRRVAGDGEAPLPRAPSPALSGRLAAHQPRCPLGAARPTPPRDPGTPRRSPRPCPEPPSARRIAAPRGAPPPTAPVPGPPHGVCAPRCRRQPPGAEAARRRSGRGRAGTGRGGRRRARR